VLVDDLKQKREKVKIIIIKNSFSETGEKK